MGEIQITNLNDFEWNQEIQEFRCNLFLKSRTPRKERGNNVTLLVLSTVLLIQRNDFLVPTTLTLVDVVYQIKYLAPLVEPFGH